MGPYCKFCGTRCFVPLPLDTPEHIKQAYRNTLGSLPAIIATCERGKAYERKRVGYCYDDIEEAQ